MVGDYTFIKTLRLNFKCFRLTHDGSTGEAKVKVKVKEKVKVKVKVKAIVKAKEKAKEKEGVTILGINIYLFASQLSLVTVSYCSFNFFHFFLSFKNFLRSLKKKTK